MYTQFCELESVRWCLLSVYLHATDPQCWILSCQVSYHRDVMVLVRVFQVKWMRTHNSGPTFTPFQLSGVNDGRRYGQVFSAHLFTYSKLRENTSVKIRMNISDWKGNLNCLYHVTLVSQRSHFIWRLRSFFLPLIISKALNYNEKLFVISEVHIGRSVLFYRSLFSTLKMEAICSSETSVATQETTWRHIPEDDTLHNQRCENLKSYILLM
jgi:hypothetical protein